MIKALIAASLILAVGAPAAQAGHRHRRYVPQKSVIVWTPWGISWGHQPRQPKIRITENCVYKPWTNRTVCRY